MNESVSTREAVSSWLHASIKPEPSDTVRYEVQSDVESNESPTATESSTLCTAPQFSKTLLANLQSKHDVRNTMSSTRLGQPVVSPAGCSDDSNSENSTHERTLGLSRSREYFLEDQFSLMFSESSYSSDGSLYVPSCYSDTSEPHTKDQIPSSGEGSKSPSVRSNISYDLPPGVTVNRCVTPPSSSESPSTSLQTPNPQHHTVPTPHQTSTAAPIDHITIVSSDDDDLEIVSVNFSQVKPKKCTCHLRHHNVESNEHSNPIDLEADWQELHQYLAEKKRNEPQNTDSSNDVHRELEVVSDDSDLYVVEDRGPIQMYPIRSSRPLRPRGTGLMTSTGNMTPQTPHTLMPYRLQKNTESSAQHASHNHTESRGAHTTMSKQTASEGCSRDLSRSPSMPILTRMSPINRPTPIHLPTTSSSIGPATSTKQTAVVQPLPHTQPGVDITKKDSVLEH